MRFAIALLALTITASWTGAQTFTLTCYDGTSCDNKVIADCEQYNSGECCNCATDDQGDPLDPSNAVEALPDTIDDPPQAWDTDSYTSTGQQTDACTNLVDTVFQGCALDESIILTGVIGVYNMGTRRRSPSADARSPESAQRKRNYLASEPTTDGRIIVYKLQMGTAKAQAYKRCPKAEQKQFIIDNYDTKVVRQPFKTGQV